MTILKTFKAPAAAFVTCHVAVASDHVTVVYELFGC